MTVTPPMMDALTPTTIMVTLTALPTMVAPLVQKPGAVMPIPVRGVWATRFAAGLPCRARCAVSSLRAGIPVASVR